MKRFLIFIFFILVSSTFLYAATRTWDGGGADNDWTTAANWVGDVAPSVGDDLVFAGSVRTSPNNDFGTGTSFNSITFSLGASDFTVTGNRINLTGGASAIQGNHTSGTMTLSLAIDFTSSAPTISTLAGGTLTMNGNTNNNSWLMTFDAAGTINFGGVISGSGGLSKNASGVLNLEAINTFTGNVTLNAGTIGLEYSNSMGATSKTIHINGGTLNNLKSGGLTLSGHAYQWNADFSMTGNTNTGNFSLGSGTKTLNADVSISTTLVVGADFFSIGSGVVSGAYDLTHLGSGYLSFPGEANTFTGKFREHSLWGSYIGSLEDLSTNSSLGAPSTTANGTIDLGLGTNSLYFVLNQPGSFKTDRVINLSGTTGSIRLWNLKFNTDSVHFTSDFTATGNGNKTLVLGGGNSANNTLDGTIPNPGTGELSLEIQSAGSKYILTGENTYTGSTSITNGTLQLGKNSSTGSISNSSNISNSGQLIVDRSNNWIYSGVISGTGTLEKKSAGTFTLTGTNTYTGNTTITAGALQIGNNGTGGEISNTSNIANNSELIVNKTSDWTYSGVISGSGTLEKKGTGVLTLSGDNTFTGDIVFEELQNVDNGVIKINHNNALGLGPKTIQMMGFDASSNRIDLENNINISGVNIEVAGKNTGREVFLRNVSGNNQWGGNIEIVRSGGGYHIESQSDSLVLNGNLFVAMDPLDFPAATFRSFTFIGNGVITVNGIIQNGNRGCRVIKDGANTMYLLNNNTYTDSTLILDGTLQIGNGGTGGQIANASNVQNSSNLIINRSNNWTYTGVIAGTGTLSKKGAGKLTLSGVNTYSGNTSIQDGGTIEFGVADALSATNLTLNSGTISTGATSGYSASLGTITVIDSNTINLGSGDHTLSFTNSSGETWSSFLLVEGWSDTDKYDGTAAGASHPKFYIGTDNTGLTSAQLSKIAFKNPSDGELYEALHLSDGEVVPTATLLPVTLLNYSAEKQGETVRLLWSTASEINSSYFEIYHSENGLDFVKISKINAAGNSSNVINYSFIHRNPSINNCYKLIQFDIDGQKHEKGIRYVNFEGVGIKIDVFPNPSNGGFTINSNKEILKIQVHDSKGSLVFHKMLNNTQSNFGNHLSPGVYYLSVFTQQGVQKLKIIKL